MNEMSDVEKTSWAIIKSGRDFIFLQTMSGYRSMRWDPQGANFLLPGDVDDQILGEAVLTALDSSRFVLPAPRADVWIHPDATFDKDLYDNELGSKFYDAWVENLVARLGYKNKRALFKSMMSCSVKRLRDEIEILPSIHEKLEAWSGMPRDQAVLLGTHNTAAEIGAGIRLAISRCR